MSQLGIKPRPPRWEASTLEKSHFNSLSIAILIAWPAENARDKLYFIFGFRHYTVVEQLGPASHDCYLVREKSRPEPRPACPCSTTRSLTNSTGIMSAYSGQPTSVPARVQHTIIIMLEIHNSISAYFILLSGIQCTRILKQSKPKVCPVLFTIASEFMSSCFKKHRTYIASRNKLIFYAHSKACKS